MKINLTIWERLRTGDFIPKRASLIEAMIAADLVKKFQFNVEEIEQYEIKSVPDLDGSASVKWNTAGTDYTKEIELSKPEIHLLKSQLAKLDKAENIDIDPRYLNLCQKINSLN